MSKISTTIEFVACEYQKRAKDKATSSERLFMKLLRSIDVAFEFQDIFYYYDENRRKTFYLLDFRLLDYNIIFEIDGSTHRTFEAETNDKIRDLRTKKAGYSTYRITNKQLFNDYEVTMRTVCKILNIDFKEKNAKLKPNNKPTKHQRSKTIFDLNNFIKSVKWLYKKNKVPFQKQHCKEKLVIMFNKEHGTKFKVKDLT